MSAIQLDEVAPLLYGSGAGALGWWRLRNTELRDSPAAEFLHQAYRLQTLQSAIHEEKIAKVFQLLCDAAIEPMLVKGWAAAGMYPERGLRPYGDIDLVVRSEKFERATEVLAQPSAKDCWVDLHRHLSEVDDRSTDQLFARARRVMLKEKTVTLLSAEDHLALLAVHLLKHGAWRPLWLCDIGAAIESLPSGFDWDICLGKNLKRARWIKTAIALAERLLSARVDRLPSEVRNLRLPEWLVESVLSQWKQPFAINQPPMNHPIPMSGALREPRTLVEALRQRWPNPILATISVNGDFNGVPRLPYQLGNCLMRAGHFVLEFPRLLAAKRNRLSSGSESI